MPQSLGRQALTELDIARIGAEPSRTGGTRSFDLEALAAALESARRHFYQLLDGAWAGVVAARALRADETAAIQAAPLTLVDACRAAVDRTYPYCGRYAAHEESDINRVWRAFHTATQHALLVP